MQFTLAILLGAAACLVPSVAAAPAAKKIPNKYTLTAYAPNNCTLNGLKAQLSGDLSLFAAHVEGYCPTGIPCPNGTETAFGGTLYPASEVPGGQDCYVTSEGEFTVTVQHSHEIPPDAYPTYEGWNWTALAKGTKAGLKDCPKDDARYNCARPSGIFTFQLAGASVGGLRACPVEGETEQAAVVYAVTPGFTRTDCTVIEGLGTHAYHGVYPPVWAYY